MKLEGGRRGRGAILAGALLALALAAAGPANAALGELDPGFGDSGATLIDPGPGAAAFTDVALTSDGRAVAAGWADGERGHDLLVSRVTPSGAPDATFNGAGWRRVPLAGGAVGDTSVALGPGGRIVAANSAPTERGGSPVLIRLTAAGELDPTFGDGGQHVLTAPALCDAYAAGVAVLPDGRLLVGGWAKGPNNEPLVFTARLQPDGRDLDPSYGNEGVAILALGAAARMTAMRVDGEGRATLAGQIQPGQGLLARFTAAGQPDPDFAGGRVVLDVPESHLTDLSVLPNGGVLAAGSAGFAGLIVRVSAAGAFDPATDADLHAPAHPTAFRGLAVDATGATVIGAAGQPGSLLLGKLSADGGADHTNDPLGTTPGFRRMRLAASDAAALGAAVVVGQDEHATMVGHVFVRDTPRPLLTRHLPNAPPSAALGGPGQVRRGSPATFDASGSDDPERAIRRYDWDFDGDGTYETSSGDSPQAAHVFPDARTVTVGVRVTDHRGLTSTAAQDVRVVRPRQPPAPEPGDTAVVAPVSGTVLIRPKPRDRPVRVTEPTEIPNGTLIDARRGQVRLVVARDDQGATDSARFWAGRFEFRQSGGAKPLTTLTLKGGRFRGCGPATPRLRATAAGKRKKKRSVRRLWGDGNGRFRTRGRYGAATVRGTRWLTDDRCAGTSIVVRRGVVTAEDLTGRRPRTRRVKAGQRTFIREP